MFIKLNEQNEIIASANFKVDDSFIETNKNIVRGFDGKLYFEEDKPDDTTYKKEIEILELKQKYSEEIYKTYPLSKQIDISGRIGEYTDTDFEEMKDFIEEKIKKYKEEKNIININFA